MIKLIIFGVLGLVVGIGGGSAMSVMSAKKAFTAFQADRAKAVADSLAATEEHGKGGDSASHADPESAPTDSATAHTESPAQPAVEPKREKPHTPDGAVAAPAGSAQHDVPLPAPKPTGTSKAVATIESHGAATAAAARPRLPALPPKPIDGAIAAAAEKVSRIFGAMPAKDAAKVLEQLDDAEVQSILGGLSGKQAAGIMQYLPPQRAAAISKLALRGGRS